MKIMFLLIAFLAGCSPMRSSTVPTTPLEAVKKQIHIRPASSLSVGVSRVDITPPVGTPLAGYSKRRGTPSTGIRDPLYVRALVLSDGEDTAVIISADQLLFPPRLSEMLIGQIASKFHISRQAIILAGTHTHSGSGGSAPGFFYRFVFGPYKKEIEEGVMSRILWAVEQALDHREPARWAFVERDVEGVSENRMTPNGKVDPEIQVVFFESSKKSIPLGMVVNFAAHPTLLESSDMRLSADFPGELTREMERIYPGVVCLFTNGAAGDLRPRDEIGENAEERVTRFGKLLAEAATGLISHMVLKPQGDIAAWGSSIQLPTPHVHFGALPIPTALSPMVWPSTAYVHVVTLDRIVFVPLSAELVAELGQNLKKEVRAFHLQPVLIGYADGYLGYAVTQEQYKNRSYETWMTWYGGEFGTDMVRQLTSLISLYSLKDSGS